MKNSLIVLAVLGTFTSVATAQSNVAVFGSFDGSLRHLTHVDAAGNDKLSISSLGLYNSNRLGFRGIESLGGGLTVRFALETAFNTGTGAGNGNLFGREATVGIGSTWGKVDIGRQFSVSARVVSSYDPFSFKYLSIIPLSREIIGTSSSRFDNDIQYTGTFGNFTARAEYVPGEQTGGPSRGTAKAVGGNYKAGPVNFGAAYTQWNDFAGPDKDRTQATIGGDYTIGAVRISGGYMDDKVKTAGVDTTSKNTWIGMGYKFGGGIELTGAYYRTKGSVGIVAREKNLKLVGLTYALSKRTLLYAEIDNYDFSGGAIVNGQTSQTGTAVGLSHTF